MVLEEPANDRLVNARDRAPRALEPRVEMLERDDVPVDGQRWIAALREMCDEILEGRGQQTAPNATRGTRRAKDVLDHDRFLSPQGAEEATQITRGVSSRREAIPAVGTHTCA
jgi:hypothetical protein